MVMNKGNVFVNHEYGLVYRLVSEITDAVVEKSSDLIPV